MSTFPAPDDHVKTLYDNFELSVVKYGEVMPRPCPSIAAHCVARLRKQHASKLKAGIHRSLTSGNGWSERKGRQVHTTG